MKTIYVSQKDNRSWSSSPSAYEGLNYPVSVDDAFTGGAMSYDRFSGEWIVDPPYEPTRQDIINEAVAMRDTLVAEANTVIYDWAIDASTGDITDEDMASLKVWRAYIKKLKALNLDDAPNIEWPYKPE